VGDFEAALSGPVESTVKYHSFNGHILIPNGKNVERQYLVGSFTGAVSSQKVTEEFIKVS